MEKVKKVAVVDDDESIRDSTRTLLRSAGYEVATFDSAEAYLGSGTVGDAGCLVLDIRMRGMDGLELQRHLHSSGQGMAIVFITAHYDERNRRLAMERGAVGFLSKPFDATTLIAAIETALAREAKERI